MRTASGGGPICRVAKSRLGLIALSVGLAAQAQPNLPRETIAAKYFGADAPWYLRNVPFFEIDDQEIQEIYYYRWKVFRSHIREIGSEGTTVLEFLDNVPWARQPFTDLNDSASFHILEGRWLRDPAIIDNLIDHLYAGGANDRHFSESIAAATESRTRVTGDPSPGLRHLDKMRTIFDQWDDHFDRARGLYWIEPLLDATEYTIASIDASGAGFTEQPSLDQNHNGFTGGFAFRPSINSYQYGNALAIARFAALAGKSDVAVDFSRRAANLRNAVLDQLWNPALVHFVDRYQRSTDGPSWPFQTSQVLTGLANLLDDYSQSVITPADYLRLLRQYTRQHLAGGDQPDIQEDYDPDTGRPIVGLARSHHYEHSTYVDLIINGLIGVRPRSDETLDIAPLIALDLPADDRRIRYFALQNLAYHGHDIGIVYDAEGSRYGAGRGLSVFVDGRRLFGPGPLQRVSIRLPTSKAATKKTVRRIDLAANPGFTDGPEASASSVDPASAISEAIDGRLWFFSSNPNGWSPAATRGNSSSWYAVDFRQSRVIGSAELYFFADGVEYLPPSAFRLQYQGPNGWQDIPAQKHTPRKPLANGENKITFPPLSTRKLRFVLTNSTSRESLRLVEAKVFGP